MSRPILVTKTRGGAPVRTTDPAKAAAFLALLDAAKKQ